MKTPSLTRGKGSYKFTSNGKSKLGTRPLKCKSNSPFTQGQEAFLLLEIGPSAVRFRASDEYAHIEKCTSEQDETEVALVYEKPYLITRHQAKYYSAKYSGLPKECTADLFPVKSWGG